jgi:hypothetical protein
MSSHRTARAARTVGPGLKDVTTARNQTAVVTVDIGQRAESVVFGLIQEISMVPTSALLARAFIASPSYRSDEYPELVCKRLCSIRSLLNCCFRVAVGIVMTRR